MTEDVENDICRVCMEDEGKLLSIFEPYEHLEVKANFPELFSTFASVEITNGDKLPEFICTKCVDTILNFYLLIDKCRESDKILKTRLFKETVDKESSDTNIIVKNELVDHTYEDPLQILELENLVDTAEKGSDAIITSLENENSDDDDVSNEETLKEMFEISGYVRCTSCTFVSTNVEMYTEHSAKHDRKFVCEVCYRQFKKSSHLGRHMKVHNREIVTKIDAKIKQRRVEKSKSVEKDSDPEDLTVLGIQIECPSCSFISTSKKMYKEHRTMNHKSKRKNTCEICNSKFLKSSHLKRHLKVHEKQKENEDETIDVKPTREELETLIANPETQISDLPEVKTEFQCRNCEFITNSEEDYKSHASTHNSNRKYVCLYCNKRFMKPYHIKRHMAVHKGEKLDNEQFECKECSKTFLNEERFKQHEATHTGIKHKSHVCEVCHKRFGQLCTLKDHLRTHSGEKPFLCSICGKGFNHMGNLRQHTAIHKGVKSHICSFCSKAFLTKGGLCTHIRRHTGARPFVCPICKKGFTTSSSMKKHERIHSGEKPYECDVCYQKFTRSGILIRHKRIHTGEKPYSCPHCTKAFSQSNDLTSHLRIHTGERPYVCDICGATFRQSSALKTHGKVHQKDVELT